MVRFPISMELGSVNLQKFEGIILGTQMIKSVGNWGGSPKRFSGDPSFSLKP